MATCEVCKKPDLEVPLKRCGRCKTTQYCGADCQKVDWQTHKKTCGKGAGGSDRTGSSSSLSPPKGLEQPIEKPFSRLVDKTWLHNRPEKDTYTLLIDAYRLRVEDDLVWGGDTVGDDVEEGFQRFLNQAAASRGLLPPWWSDEKRTACEKFAQEDRWANLKVSKGKSEMIDRYGDSSFPMQLRMLAEQVIGSGPGGQAGSAMMNVMASMEGGERQGMQVTQLDMSNMFK